MRCIHKLICFCLWFVTNAVFFMRGFMNQVKEIKNVILKVLCSLLFLQVVFAHGAKDIDEKSAENMESWQETFDLAGKKSGKFNIMITASDLGGNIAIEGPHNIWLDPRSDLPVCGITNPVLDMRVAGNLNIVGTCIDDDGVQYVELFFDNDEENPVRAFGREFWSYYYNTTDLAEGMHTIKAVGTDINGLKGNPVTVTWNLDRRAPISEVKNHAMGVLLSGKTKFSGEVTDGNGIEKLEYSFDNGNVFTELKLSGKKEEKVKTFSIPIDTTKFEDGPNVVWIKALDNAGSEGLYSFLYFIDNTKPVVKIITPEEKSVQYGKFAVTGSVTDALEIVDLSWQFGAETGKYDIIPGNPYWGIVFDTIGSSGKSRKFTITATDRAGNVTSVSRTIPLDQLLDKPTVSITYPTSDTLLGSDDKLYLRGIAKDEQGIQSIKYKLDSGEWLTQETKGVFSVDLINGSDLTSGVHTITVIAVDKNGVEGDKSSVSFSALGPIPLFSEAKIGKETVYDGIVVHPESGSSFTVTASSGLGLDSLSAEVRWGADRVKKFDYAPNGSTSQSISIPFDSDGPKGVVKVYLTATDKAGRSKDYKSLVYVVNTSKVKSVESAVVFDDSAIGEDGVIINNAEFPVTGYFIGGNAKGVSIIPSTPFARAELKGNIITLVPGKALGVSEPVVVRVVTDQGIFFDSRQLIFKNDAPAPKIVFNSGLADGIIDKPEDEITISGNVVCESGISRLSYRVFSSLATIEAGTGNVVSAMRAISQGSLTDIPVSNTFSIPFNAAILDAGLYIVEVVAESVCGNTFGNAICISTIPELEKLPTGKMPAAKNPMIVWVEGENVYFAAAYQGASLDSRFGVFYKSDMPGGVNQITKTVTDLSNNKKTTSKIKFNKPYSLQAHFASIGDEQYKSGMPVVLAKGETSKITAYIDTEASLSSLSYKITGEETPGGKDLSGSAKATKSLEVDNRWVVEIPITNLPVRMNKITVSIKAGNISSDLVGLFEIVRPSDSNSIDDERAIYIMESSDIFYDKATSSYIVPTGQAFNFYANIPAIDDVALINSTGEASGLSIDQKDKNVTVTFTKEGFFQHVQLRIKDINGISYTSPALNFIVDSGAPELVISTPKNQQWVKNMLRITGTVVDSSGIKSGDYSIDGGETWNPISISRTTGSEGAVFSATADISNYEEGLIEIDVRVFDTASNVSYQHISVQRDITPPSVEVIMPTDDATVNGINLIGFKVYDNGSLGQMTYIAPPDGKTANSKVNVDIDNFVLTHIGTTEKPIDDAMSFKFADDAGNVTTIESWDFMIDRESDLPVVEIHIPLEDEVITRDFTISGVVYDDDGPSEVYYRIDNNAYKLVTSPEGEPIVTYDDNGNVKSSVPDYKRTSYAIPIDFSTLTDNEHIISIYAVDCNGVKGEPTERKIRVSTEEPKGVVFSPDNNTTVRGEITVKGVASDKNGIEKVLISLDNGNSYNNTVGQESWSYTFDTRAIPNGTSVIFIKVFDKYGIQALYSSLISIDNEAPEMILDFPLDSASTAGPLFFSGYAFDNVAIEKMYVTIRSLDGKSIPKDMQKINFDLGRIIATTVDMTSLDNGSYNVELTALDKAGNETHLSRNVFLNKTKALAAVDLLYPLNGEHKRGYFNIYGQVSSDKPVESLALYLNDTFVRDTKPLSTNYFKFEINPEDISEGVSEYRVDARLEGGTVIRSRVQTVEYSSIGPWVKIDNFAYGDFAIERPYIKGTAGYQTDSEELIASKLKDAPKELKDAVKNKKVQKVEISFDNGRTFKQVSKHEQWMYRVENKDIPEGYHFMLVRATMRNGESAIERVIIQVDNTVPKIRLIAPQVGGRYNQELLFSGISSDNVGLKNVTLALRKGDKASYEVPKFIQGLYIDWKFWGATLFDIGAGLTFFDDNVKVQFQWGQFTRKQYNIFRSGMEYRYGGSSVIGLKIIANIAQIPFAFFFGRDFEWLSASVAVGAHFSIFNMDDDPKQRGSQTLSAIIAQVEFPKVTFPKAKCFSSFSLYTEFSLWFIPSDIAGEGKQHIQSVVPQWSEGIRVNVF